jgi:hypothetical protein
MKILTLTTDLEHPGFLQFKRYYDHFGYDYDVLNPSVSAFGEQMPFIVEWCKQNRGEEVIYVDAWDTIAVADMTELRSKLPECEFYGGAEYGCWPDAYLIDKFPNLDRPYKYLCGGTWYAKTDLIIEMAERFPNTQKDNDQHWLQKCFLKLYNEGRNVQLDNYGNIFQSIMLDDPETFVIENGRVTNTLYDTKPVIIHGNGKKDMTKYYSIL